MTVTTEVKTKYEVEVGTDLKVTAHKKNGYLTNISIGNQTLNIKEDQLIPLGVALKDLGKYLKDVLQ